MICHAIAATQHCAGSSGQDGHWPEQGRAVTQRNVCAFVAVIGQSPTAEICGSRAGVGIQKVDNPAILAKPTIDRPGERKRWGCCLSTADGENRQQRHQATEPKHSS